MNQKSVKKPASDKTRSRRWARWFCGEAIAMLTHREFFAEYFLAIRLRRPLGLATNHAGTTGVERVNQYGGLPTKAAEGCRTPRRFASAKALAVYASSWTAQAPLRF